MEVGEAFFSRVRGVLAKVTCKVPRCRWRVPVPHWEVIALHDVVVVLMGGLAMGHVYDEEVRFDLCDAFSFL